MTNGNRYYYFVKGVNTSGEGAQSNEVSATPIAIPSGLTAVPADSQVTLNWQASTGAASYKLYRSDAAGVEADPPHADIPVGTTYTDKGLTNGHTYYYEVSAVSPAGTTPRSNEASAIPSAAPGGGVLAAPVLKAAAGAAEVDLSWSPVDHADSYNNYRSAVAGGEGSAAYVTGAAGPSYTDTAFTGVGPFFYKVAAVSKAGVGALSNEPSATPGIAPLPTTLAMTASPAHYFDQQGMQHSKVSLVWEPVQGATSYNLYRGTAAGSEGPAPAVLKIPFVNGQTAYTDDNIPLGTTYYYRLAAVDADGEGALSTELIAQTGANMDASAPLVPYFSGTNATFPNDGMNARTWAGDLAGVQLTLGNQMIDGIPPFTGNYWGLENWFFDSASLFTGSAVVPFKLHAADTGNDQVIASGFGTNFNRAFLMSNRTWGFAPPGGVGDVAFQAFNDGDDRLEHMNNALVPTLAELKPDILNGLPEFNLIYAITHCAPNEMGDCQSVPTSGPASILYGHDDQNGQMTITAAVGNKGGQAPLPPLPGYRFVFILGCNAAGTTALPDHSLAHAFGVDDGQQVDTGFLGFQTPVEIDQQNVIWCDAVLDALRGGATLAASVDAANKSKGAPDGWDEGADLPMPGQAVPVHYGDPNMTLFGVVYGGAPYQQYTGEPEFRPGG
ncbi:MAG TPA: hypothetical protein VFJ58_00750 [Armatimonadota bacterium]|nr:hypothetical protein [Armatimonadota bacterium]